MAEDGIQIRVYLMTGHHTTGYGRIHVVRVEDGMQGYKVDAAATLL